MAMSICCALSAAAAWWLALTYIRMGLPETLFSTALTAAICGVGTFCLSAAGLPALAPLVSLIVFLLVMFGIQLRRRGNCGDAVLAFYWRKADTPSWFLWACPPSAALGSWAPF